MRISPKPERPATRSPISPPRRATRRYCSPGSLPEGWNPTDFIVYYTDADSETVTLRTGGEMNCTVGGLVNDTQYTFYVQAVYGKLVSNYVAAVGRPATTRFPVTDLTVDAGDSFVSLAWTKPATTVLSYTLSYYNEDAPDNVEQQTLDKDATSVTLDKLTNDKNYYFSLTANYEKGASEPATAKAMPTLAIPYILDRDQAAQNQPITFSFNTQDYPTATDVKWTFPGNVVKEGTVVKYGLGTIGTQTVKLNAMIDGNAVRGPWRSKSANTSSTAPTGRRTAQPTTDSKAPVRCSRPTERPSTSSLSTKSPPSTPSTSQRAMRSGATCRPPKPEATTCSP